MSDRLSELQRQRALIQGHLAWLDREIANEAGPATKPPTTALPAAKLSRPEQAIDPVVDTAVVAQFSAESKNATESVRKGCFIVFGLALVLFCAGVYGLYLYSRNIHRNDAPPAPKATNDLPENRDHR